MASFVLATLRPAARSCRTLAQTSIRNAWEPRLYSTNSKLLAKKYTESHEWVDLGADGKTCTIGITEHAAKALGDIVYVELPEEDQTFEQGDVLGVVESVKSASDIISPVSGKVVEANSSLGDTPSALNKESEGSAWLAKIEIEDVSILDSLMSKESYDEFAED